MFSKHTVAWFSSLIDGFFTPLLIDKIGLIDCTRWYTLAVREKAKMSFFPFSKKDRLLFAVYNCLCGAKNNPHSLIDCVWLSVGIDIPLPPPISRKLCVRNKWPIWQSLRITWSHRSSAWTCGFPTDSSMLHKLLMFLSHSRCHLDLMCVVD